MNKKSFLMFLLFFFSFAILPAFAGTATIIDGISFSIDKASFGSWSKPRHHMVNDMVDHADQGSEALSYIAVTYSLTNGNETKKIDLDQKINYALFDEYGNRYRPMRKPEDFKGPVLTVAKNFPSLYPGEIYGETLFFEAPLAVAKRLNLVISSENFKLSKPVELAFSPDGGSSVPDPAPLVLPKIEETTEPARIIVVSPASGVVWDQGQTAHIRVASSNGKAPRKIVVIALNNTFQDNSPGKDNLYDINIPLDQPPGAFMINIIAQWPNDDIGSATLPFYVKDATPLGVL